MHDRSSTTLRLPILAALLLALPGEAAAEQKLELGAPFLDDMILQRGMEVPVWGWAERGSKVTVSFAGQTIATDVGAEGDWMVKLDPLEASATERELRVQCSGIRGQETRIITLRGVLVGEVWFSSGQSNMVWTAGKSMCSEIAREIAGAQEDVPIRELGVDTVSALYPQKRVTSDGGWKKARRASEFSALSLALAYELYVELDVPIGIVLSAHSNTRIEAFTRRQAIEAHPRLQEDARLIHDADPLTEQGRAAYARYFVDLRAWQREAGAIAMAGGRIPERPPLPGIAGMWRGPSQFFNGKIAPIIPYAIRGAIWCQGTSNGGDGRIYAARMEALVKGWRDAWAMPDMPFYFTQMQCYGAPDPNSVGFADLRQVQYMFFMNNRKNVGMVVQSDMNSARPGGIHYWNKLHPGMRMARWALAKDYGKTIACTGPIYTGHKVEGSRVVVSFEKESLFGGLMVGSKGQKLNHFRLCGDDKKWHAADAVIAGDTVVVTSPKVPKPIGVQYAYSAVPENSNLYNKAGLPATGFAAVNGKLIFEEDDLAKAAALKAKYARYTDPDYPILQVVEYYRDGAVIQRDKTLPIWGHANKGVKVTVTLGGVTRTAVANDLQQWAVSFPPMKASTEPITLTVKSSHGHSRTVRNILVGDVWYLTGSTQLNGEMAVNRRDKNAKPPAPMPLVREFRRKTKADSSATPRKRRFETGGGRYRSSWMAADFSDPDKGVTMFAYHFAKTLGRKGIPQGFITMSSGRGGRSGQMASPLSWTSFHGVKDIKAPAFKARLDELFLQYPNSDVAKKAADKHVEEVKAYVKAVIDAGKRGADMSQGLPLGVPAFPQPGKSDTVKSDMIPTYAYNWCVSPMTPMAVAGVIWVPAEYNLGYTPANYAAELEIHAKSLPTTYGLDKVQFIYAQPAGSLVKGITAPEIPGAKCVSFDQWPKSLKDMAIEMAKRAE